MFSLNGSINIKNILIVNLIISLFVTLIVAIKIGTVETIDTCTQKVVEAGLKNDYAFLIIADHGNADFAINPDGTPNTAHSTNLVPCFALNTGFENIENGKLGDIAPTILKIMGVEIPNEMTGDILIK